MTGLITDSDEHRAIRESVAGIAERYGAQYFLKRGREGRDIEELWKDLGASGLLGVHLPEEYGGAVAGWPRPSWSSRNWPPTACHC